MTTPLVTIGIATYNRSKFIARCVDSVLAQTYEPVEVVVIDDGSTDDTLRILDTYGERIRVYPNGANYGVAYSKNRALMLGTGSLRGILDSDDYYQPTFIERCVTELERDPSVGLVYTDNDVVDASGTYKRTDIAGDWCIEMLLRCQMRGDSWLAHSALLENTQWHDEMFPLEVDYDLFYQLAELASFRRIPEPLQVVTEHDERVTGDRQLAAYWHAAGLAKYGYPSRWARLRARAHPEWTEAIVSGYAFGERYLRHLRALHRLPRPNANTAEYWSREWDRRWSSTEVDSTLLADLLAWIPRSVDTIVDLGCGTGALTRGIAEERLLQAHVSGYDYAAEAIERARKLDGSIVDYHVWDFERNATPSDASSPHSVDVVVCVEVIEHLRNPLRIFEVARAMLGPRGHLVLTTPFAHDVTDSLHVWSLMPGDIRRLAAVFGGHVIHASRTGDCQRLMLYVIVFE